MIRQILGELRKGPTTVSELSRRLGVEVSALREILRFMARKGLLQEVHPECRARGCLGCPYHGRCEEREAR